MKTFKGGRVVVKLGDITREDVDAIVNAANPTLLGGGGVDGAIHRAGGPAILEECRAIRRDTYPRGLPRGEAVITTGGNLKARRVIHTAGPIWSDSADPETLDAELASCYSRSLAVAREHGLASVAFPAISTGVYGFPKERAAGVASLAVSDYLDRDPGLRMVVFVFFGDPDMRVFLENCRFKDEGDRS